MSHPQLRILLVDDDEDDYLITRSLLRDIEDVELQLDWVSTYQDGLRAMRDADPEAPLYDVCLLDYRLGSRDGLELLCEGCTPACPWPVILLTGQESREVDLAASAAGAVDYLVKGQINAPLLERSIRYATERAASLRSLRTAQARLAGIVGAAMDAIVSIDAAQRIILFNPAAERMFGYASSDLLGQPLERLIPLRFRAAHGEHIQAFGKTGMTSRKMGDLGAINGLRANGEEFPIEASISQIEVIGEKLFTVILRDITERRQAEAAAKAKHQELQAMSQQFWQATKLATVGELAASVAHELNNPMSTVTLRVESLLEEASEDAPGRRALEVIQQETARMSNLIANLLQFSRRSVAQVSTLYVRDEIEGSLELIHHHLRNRRVIVKREYTNPSTMVHADHQQLRQLFLNLFTNACDAMPQGGTLTLRVLAELARVVIEVTDTGEGIAGDILPKVFESFFTTKPEGQGTGLGLPICRRIVQEHRGTLDITSVVGLGTTVRITLPTTSVAASSDVHSGVL